MAKVIKRTSNVIMVESNGKYMVKMINPNDIEDFQDEGFPSGFTGIPTLIQAKDAFDKLELCMSTNYSKVKTIMSRLSAKYTPHYVNFVVDFHREEDDGRFHDVTPIRGEVTSPFITVSGSFENFVGHEDGHRQQYLSNSKEWQDSDIQNLEIDAWRRALEPYKKRGVYPKRIREKAIKFLSTYFEDDAPKAAKVVDEIEYYHGIEPVEDKEDIHITNDLSVDDEYIARELGLWDDTDEKGD